MVKKIGPKTPSSPASAVHGTGSIAGSKVDSVTGVAETKRTAGAERVRQATRRLTNQERDELFRMVKEEADKLFSSNALPEEKRKVVEGAVQMAIEAGLVEEDEEN